MISGSSRLISEGSCTMLKIEALHTYYGAIHALKGINLHVDSGEVVCLIGANGAGKSTLVNTVSGVIRSRSGSVFLNDQEITNKPAYQIVKHGMSLSPEGREVFPALTVEENLRLGAFIVKDKALVKSQFDYCYTLFPKLKERMNQTAGTLSGGEQQMLAIARALMNRPKLLLLDEPSLGLAPNIVMQIFELIKRISDQGMTILLIEQNANMALQISDRAYVMENGVVSMEGDAKTIGADERVRRIYLGI